MKSTKSWHVGQDQINPFANVAGMLAQLALRGIYTGHEEAGLKLARMAFELEKITQDLVDSGMAPPFDKGWGL
jgi:hypothetical protein